MKLAAIYNCFDGEELLPGSIRQIQGEVDELIIVYQYESNSGEWYHELATTLVALKATYPEATFREYHPDLTISPQHNELKKRTVGLEMARDMGCTHFLMMDNDEYYDTGDFAKARQQIAYEAYDTTACRLFTYYQQPTYRLEPMEGYYVPFICRLKPETRLGFEFPVLADPTRRVQPAGKFYAFEPTELVMHHYSYVRNDLGRKLRNSSARRNLDNLEEKLAEHKTWQPGEPPVFFPNYTITTTNNLFNIKTYG